MSQPMLFHLIADAASAHVRRRLVELGLESAIGFRNVHFEQHREALKRLGGEAVPAVWDGAVLHAGEEAAVAALEQLARPREP